MDNNMEEPKVYFCFEAVSTCQEHVPMYLIYSAKPSDLLETKVHSRDTFRLEAQIKGLEDMGCGVFDSKIVFAGGSVTEHVDKPYRCGMITYDTQRRRVSYIDIPPMQGLKIRPIVVELCERLYVLNTSTYSRRRSFEIYYPKQNFWSEMMNPYFIQSSSISGNKKISGRTPFSWFVFGNCLCISSPDGPSYLHHAKQICKSFMPNYNELLPFRGMATTYLDPRYKDVVLIYLSEEGYVEGRRLNVYPSYFGEPVKIFETEPYETEGELSSYFADCGKGNFCLAVFDNIRVHVYMFTIVRLPDKANGELNFQLKRRGFHEYSFSDFSQGGITFVNFLGCFALPTDDRNKQVKEAGLYHHHFSYEESGENDDDIPIRTTPKLRQKTEYSSEDDSNSGEYDSEDYDSGSDVEIYD